MTNIDHDALEDLLRHAPPRLAPSPADEAAVRDAVRAEWRELTGKRQMRRRVTQYAIAATVLLAAFAGFSVFRAPVGEAFQVATIEKSFGAVYLLVDQAELHATSDLSEIHSGQTIVTYDEAGLALAWGGGGSVRIGSSSRVRFTENKTVWLEAGKIYFDSLPASLAATVDGADVPEFILATPLGEVQHLGTQYMAEVDDGKLIVSVREGEVAIDGKYHDRTVKSGKQATISGRQQPSILNFNRYGEPWSWVSRTTPPVDGDGKSTYDLLLWACRELGLEPRFIGRAEEEAKGGLAYGIINKEPAEILRGRLLAASLDGTIEEGVIHITYIP